MEKQHQQDRFANYEENFNSDGIAIGFTLPGVDFLFRYDSEGGWKDEKGNYYNSSGQLVKQNDLQVDDESESSSDEEILDQFERMLDDEV